MLRHFEQFDGASPLVTLAPSPVTGSATRYTQGLSTNHPFPSSLYRMYTLLVVVIFRLPHLWMAPAGGFLYGTNPSVLQALKMLTILPPQAHPLHPHLVRHALTCLASLLSRNLNHPRGNLTDHFSVQSIGCNMDRGGLPLHLTPLVSTQARETDRRLLHTITLGMDGCSCLYVSRYRSGL